MKFLFKCFNHKEETPSLQIDVIKGKYYCFSCGVSGHTSENKEVIKMIISHLKSIIDYMEGFLEDD